MYELPVPRPYKPEVQVVSKLKPSGTELSGKDKKCVRFQEVDADDLEECGHEKELKVLQDELDKSEQEKYRLYKKLT